MRYERDFKFWVVVNATPNSELGDVLYEASLADLELQIKGGLSVADNPTLFTDREEAEAEAHGRLLAAEIEARVRALADRIGEAVRQGGGVRDVLRRARRLHLRDENGETLLDIDLGGHPTSGAPRRR